MEVDEIVTNNSTPAEVSESRKVPDNIRLIEQKRKLMVVLVRLPEIKQKEPSKFRKVLSSNDEKEDFGKTTQNGKFPKNKENRRSLTYTLDTIKRNNWSDVQSRIIRAFRKGFHVPNSAPPLTKQMIVTVHETLEKSPDIYIHSPPKFGFPMTIASLKNFDRSNWLDDLTIDFYMKLIQARNNSSSDLPQLYTFYSLFYTIYEANSHNYEIVRETTDSNDIFQYDRIFIPVNLSHHWSLVYVEPRRKIIAGLDSLGKNTMPTLATIHEYLKCERDKLRRREAAELNGRNIKYGQTGAEYFEGWRLFNAMAPMQTNNSDCGVFILQYADYLARKEPFNFEQRNMPYFRQRMAFETIQGELLN